MTEPTNPNNVCVVRFEKEEHRSSTIVYRVVTRYNFSPKPLGAQHTDAVVGEFNSLADAVGEVKSVAHFNKQLTPCCSTSLLNRRECRDAGLRLFQ